MASTNEALDLQPKCKRVLDFPSPTQTVSSSNSEQHKERKVIFICICVQDCRDLRVCVCI